MEKETGRGSDRKLKRDQEDSGKLRGQTLSRRGGLSASEKGHRLESLAYPFALHASVSLGFKGVNESLKVTRLL